MADKRDYYEVLGVKKDATADEIKKAFRKLTKENHPDLHPGDKACEERFKEANEAYEVLSDEEKRRKYDQYGHAAFDPNAGFGGGGFGDFSGFGGFVISAASAALATSSAISSAALAARPAQTPTRRAGVRTCAPP